MATQLKDAVRAVDATAAMDLLPGRPATARPRGAHPRRGHSAGPAQRVVPATRRRGGLPDDRGRERLPDGPGRGRLRRLGQGHPRRGDGARIQPRVGRLRGQPRTRALDAGVQHGPARLRAAPLRRCRRPAGDHRRREPPAGPDRTPRLPCGRCGHGPAPLHRGDARPPHRGGRPMDRPRRDDGPLPVRGALGRGRGAAAARRRPGGAARRTGPASCSGRPRGTPGSGPACTGVPPPACCGTTTRWPTRPRSGWRC
ncbi:hypothetical protein SHIRM173S_08787 [Streptomyces hirsutus]